MAQIELDTPCAQPSTTLGNGDKEMCTQRLEENTCGIQMEYDINKNRTHVTYRTEIKTGDNQYVHDNGNVTIYQYV